MSPASYVGNYSLRLWNKQLIIEHIVLAVKADTWGCCACAENLLDSDIFFPREIDFAWRDLSGNL